jgi:hypothetical protein
LNCFWSDTEDEVIDPDSNGMPLADNSLQFGWIVTIKGNWDDWFAHSAEVFVAGDHLIFA